MSPAVPYSFGATALRRWSHERLQWRRLADRSIEARFRYEGTTCSNLERPLAFDYHVRLSSRETGYSITDLRCAPVARVTGYTFMCRYQDEGPVLLDRIAAERPLLGLPLDAVLTWERGRSPAGCYCLAEGREHKWGLVLEVLHFALLQQDQLDGIL